MLALNKKCLENPGEWLQQGIDMPAFDYEKMAGRTGEKPEWVHFGAGNIFRGFMAVCHQELLEKGLAETGIIAVETFDREVIDRIYRPHDNLALFVAVEPDGRQDMRAVASVALGLNVLEAEDWKKLGRIFSNPSLKMASFTVTEKGYYLGDSAGGLIEIIRRDLEQGLEAPAHLISKLVALMYGRYRAGKYPVALVSMDNCSHNGEILRNAVLTLAGAFRARGDVDAGFIDYLSDEKTVAFPWTMIDKIIPRPSPTVKARLDALGIADMDIVITAKNTFIAPFVNAESTQYLFIEDNFPNGRLPLDKTKGIWYADRDTVNKVETMKVTTCLNPLHTAISIFGCLLNIALVVDAMKDEDIRALAHKIGYDEGLPVVVDPKIINPRQFLDEVLNERFVNPFVPDTTKRIATDTSMKVGIRYGETIKAYLKSDRLSVDDLWGIPLAIAAWCRYLLAMDDEGNAMELSPDPRLDELQKVLAGVRLGDSGVELTEILSNRAIFGSDLYQSGLGRKIERMFNEMIAGKGAVRKTLKKYLAVK